MIDRSNNLVEIGLTACYIAGLCSTTQTRTQGVALGYHISPFQGDAETSIVAAGQGRTVHEWRSKPSKPDNHWFDCLVGCAVAASMAGVEAPGETATGRQRRRYTQADLARR